MQNSFWRRFFVLGLVLELVLAVIIGRQTLYPQVVKAQQYAQSQPQLQGKTYLPAQSVIFVAAERNIRIAVFRYHGRIYINAYHIADHKKFYQQSYVEDKPLDSHSIAVRWDMPDPDRTIFDIPLNPIAARVYCGSDHEFTFWFYGW